MFHNCGMLLMSSFYARRKLALANGVQYSPYLKWFHNRRHFCHIPSNHASAKSYLLQGFRHRTVNEIGLFANFHSGPSLHSNDISTISNKDNKLRKLLQLVKPESKSLAGAISLLVVSSSISLSVPFLMGKLIDIVQEASEKGALQETLQPILAVLTSIFLVGALANFGRIYLLQISGQRITKNLRENLFSSIVAQEIAFFDKTSTGELINRLASDVQVVSGAVTQNVSDGLRAVAQVSAGVGMMFYMSSDLAKIILCVVPPVALAAVVYGKYLRDLTSRTQDKLAESSQVAEEKISSIRTVRSFAKEFSEQRSYEEKMTDVLHLSKKESVARSLFFGLAGLSGNAIVLLVLYNGGLMMQAGQITIGDLSAFLLYSTYVALSIGRLSTFYSTIIKSIGASDRLWDLIERTPKIPLNVGVVPEDTLVEGDIKFDQVQFSYPERNDQPVFTSLDLTIEAGKVTAIVGPSGCGKTTIGSLLLRFYEPDSGRVTMGEKNLLDLNPVWIRNQVGTVSQEPTLFSTTIRDNIAYGVKDGNDVSMTEVEDAARKANAYDFITELPKGFETQVGERGITLSGGQRQRVAIARALLKNPKILLLDEATSALDATSEYLVQDALEKLYVGRTTIVIAHRLSTVRGAHSIIVLGEDGKVKEQGSYDQLMNIDGGYFRQLVERQTLLS